MKFRRKSEADADDTVGTAEEQTPVTGPFDADELPVDDPERIDLGSLLIAPAEGRELRLQVDDASGVVQSVILAGPDGGLELRAFSAPRGGDLWAEARPQIAADVAQAGGTATEREGPFGTELICEVASAQRSSGRPQVSRVIGINGPRWMLRATLLGRPADQPDGSQDWEDTVRTVAVRRGNHAMPVGEALPVVMPPQARRTDQ